jgi:hypothetical protein
MNGEIQVGLLTPMPRWKRGRPRVLTVVLALVAAATLATPRREAAPAEAYCTAPINRWLYNSYTLHVNSTIPSGWQTAISASRSQWSNVSGSALVYYVQFNSNHPNNEFRMSLMDFSAIGWPDVPGGTINTPSGGATHTFSLVGLNSDFTWNTSGTMNQAQRLVDANDCCARDRAFVGFESPSICGDDSAEIIAAMHPTGHRWYTNSDDDAGVACSIESSQRTRSARRRAAAD